jgi:hypothetical protein
MQRYSYFDAYSNHTLSAEDESKIQNLVQFLDGKAYWCMYFKNYNQVSMCDLGYIYNLLEILDLNIDMPEVFAVDEKTCDRYALHNYPPQWNYHEASDVKLDEFVTFNLDTQIYIDNFNLAPPNNDYGLALADIHRGDTLLEFFAIQADIRVEAIARISEFFNR